MEGAPKFESSPVEEKEIIAEQPEITAEQLKEDVEDVEEAKSGAEIYKEKEEETKETVEDEKEDVEQIEQIESLEKEATKVSQETGALVKEIESVDIDKIEKSGINTENLGKLREKLDTVVKSWEGVSKRAMALGVITVLAVDMAVLATGNVEWKITTGAPLVAAAAAANVIGYNVNRLIHSFKESSTISKIKKEGGHFFGKKNI